MKDIHQVTSSVILSSSILRSVKVLWRSNDFQLFCCGFEWPFLCLFSLSIFARCISATKWLRLAVKIAAAVAKHRKSTFSVLFSEVFVRMQHWGPAVAAVRRHRKFTCHAACWVSFTRRLHYRSVFILWTGWVWSTAEHGAGQREQ